MYNETAQNRYELLLKLEKKHNLKIITLVGLSPLSNVDQTAAQKVIRNLQKIGPESDVGLFINTIGGEIRSGWRIANEILGRTGETVIFVTHQAKSTGTLIALSGTKIVSRPQSEFGPTDPQVPVVRRGFNVNISASELLNAGNDLEQIQAKKAIRETKDYLNHILKTKFDDPETIKNLADIFLRQKIELMETSHSYPLSPNYLNSLGFELVQNSLPDFCELYNLYLNDPERHLLEGKTHLVEMLCNFG